MEVFSQLHSMILSQQVSIGNFLSYRASVRNVRGVCMLGVRLYSASIDVCREREAASLIIVSFRSGVLKCG